MKTTLNIDDTVMQRLREEAARRGTTMSAPVEASSGVFSMSVRPQTVSKIPCRPCLHGVAAGNWWTCPTEPNSTV